MEDFDIDSVYQAGYSDGANSTNVEYKAVKKKIERLVAQIGESLRYLNENAKLKDRLAAYENGIKPEEAVPGRRYIYTDKYGVPWFVRAEGAGLGFMGISSSFGNASPIYPRGLIYPLPPTQAEGEE